VDLVLLAHQLPLQPVAVVVVVAKVQQLQQGEQVLPAKVLPVVVAARPVVGVAGVVLVLLAAVRHRERQLAVMA
jgi:hypothetical protein